MIVVRRRPVQDKLQLVVMEAEDLVILKKGKNFICMQISRFDTWMDIYIFFYNHVIIIFCM